MFSVIDYYYYFLFFPFILFQSQQIRAFSSPTLSDCPVQITKYVKKPSSEEATHVNKPNQSASVLQKFKKTFSSLKNKSSTNSATNSIMTTTMNMNSENGDTTTYRFGPLMWRTSKERRKAKHYRRDKCNSGDSGIQIELENDENISKDVTDSMDMSPSLNSRVRRANSARINSTLASNIKSRAQQKTDNFDRRRSSSLHTRSLSQPYGLNRIPSSR